jgi:hypothetical protein
MTAEASGMPGAGRGALVARVLPVRAPCRRGGRGVDAVGAGRVAGRWDGWDGTEWAGRRACGWGVDEWGRDGIERDRAILCDAGPRIARERNQ